MYRIDDPSASTTLPTPETALTEGYWTEGNPGSGIPATLERASWFNMIQEELRAIPVAAGLTPSKTTYNQILTALKSMFSSVVGTVRNLSMNVAASSATAAMTADEIVVETALGGQTYRLASFSKTINLATTGAGGMDTGTAPVSGYVALYAIYNPTTATAALLATNATSAVAANVYGGANMPSGYTASALVSVWGTTAASLFRVGSQRDRDIEFVRIVATATNTTASSNTSFSLASAIPLNGKKTKGTLQVGSNTAASINGAVISSDVSSTGYSEVSATGLQTLTGLWQVNIITPQTLYYTFNSNGTGPGLTIYITGYSI